MSGSRAECQRVLLIHGLWMGAGAMMPLARALARHEFRCESFAYPTVTRSPDASAGELAVDLRRSGIRRMVAHSLGGLIALQALAATPDLQAGRLVLLGSPIRGSRVAARIGTWPGLGRALGTARRVLEDPGDLDPGGWEVGQVAGTKRIGLGLLAGGGARPSDGSVAVEETRAPWLADHLTLPVSHTGLLFSSRVAAAAVRFLETGHFAG